MGAGRGREGRAADLAGAVVVDLAVGDGEGAALIEDAAAVLPGGAGRRVGARRVGRRCGGGGVRRHVAARCAVRHRLPRGWWWVCKGGGGYGGSGGPSRCRW